MADEVRDERMCIRDIAKSHRKYGTTANHVKRNDRLIKHTVVPSDTLQGISLKYGVSMELIKRANKIWTNDSLFLRDVLDIPVSQDTPQSLPPSSDDSPYNCKQNQNDISVMERLQVTPSGAGNCSSQDRSEQSVEDILVRIDNSIAESRSKIQELEKSNDFHQEDACGSKRRSHQSRMKQSMNHDPAAATVVMTQGRKVATSLQRLEKEQDELFEL